MDLPVVNQWSEKKPWLIHHPCFLFFSLLSVREGQEGNGEVSGLRLVVKRVKTALASRCCWWGPSYIQEQPWGARAEGSIKSGIRGITGDVLLVLVWALEQTTKWMLYVTINYKGFFVTGTLEQSNSVSIGSQQTAAWMMYIQWISGVELNKLS